VLHEIVYADWIYEMEKISIIITTGIAFLVLFSCSNQTRKYIEKVTNVTLPSNTEIIETYDNGEFFLISKLRMGKKDQIASIIKIFDLKQLTKNISVIHFDKALSEENRVIINNVHDFYFTIEENTAHQWRVLCNMVTGELWIEIIYPDYAGDI
jgi:hypothetical protein